MDTLTIDTYNQDAQSISDLHKSLVPERLYQLAKTYFYPNAKTIDIGCGIGSDTHWLNQNGFNAVGIDGSLEMLNFASLNYPETLFIHDYLPELEYTTGEDFTNIFCSAVLMHLTTDNIKLACDRFDSLIGEDACILISYRDTNQSDWRENGKLYTPISADTVVSYFTSKGYKSVVNETTVDTGRGLNWTNLVFKR
jgi:2-polyprenyl-3-methyl-5-hydroxy-6-metoxy-1,4-benzoquinol methylase